MKIDLRERPVLVALNEPERRIVHDALKKFRDDYFLSCRTGNKEPDRIQSERIDSLLFQFQ
jgi:predicted RNA-binding protein Jag